MSWVDKANEEMTMQTETTSTAPVAALPEGFDYLAEQVCPKTGLYVQRYEDSYLNEWAPSMPEGWEVFDDVCEGNDPEYQKWHERSRARRIGPARVVWALSAAAVGASFTPAEVN